jgi:bla regulator protein BlaR1
MNLVCDIFTWFVYSTLAASAVALIVMAVLRLFRHRLSARIRHALWLIVLIRLLVPVFPNSPVSIFNVLPYVLDFQHKQSTAAKDWLQFSQEDQLLQHNSNMIEQVNPNLAEAISPPQDNLYPAAPSTDRHPLALKIVSIVWLAGVMVIMSYLLWTWLEMRNRFRTLRIVTEPRILTAMNQCGTQLGITKSIPVYTGNYAGSPHISGIVRPRIYIPEVTCKEMSTTQLYHIFLHEAAHYLRKDIAWNLLGSLALAIHWMNPLAWLVTERMKEERELACDACVLESLGEAGALPYGMTIIEYLKRYSSERDQPSLLYFGGSNRRDQIVRRMKMIQSFKKGSYKLSTIAVILVIIISAVTLTNAAKPVTASTPASTKDRILFDSSFRSYNNLDKGAKVAGFKFKVPDILPGAYQFEKISLKPNKPDGAQLTEASVTFAEYKGSVQTGSVQFTATKDRAGLEAAYADIEQSQAEPLSRGIQVETKKESLTIQGLEVLKVTINLRKMQRFIYIWQDGEVQYQLNGNGNLSNEDLLKMVASMKIPDEAMNKRYVDDNHMLNVRIYDTDDLRKVPSAIGFTPKFPLQLSEPFKPVGAYVTQKINFSFPADEVDKKTRLLSLEYRSADESMGKARGFTFMQIKNGTIYEDIKRNGQVAFQRIDGQRNVVEASSVEVGGREAIRTVPFKIDGPLSEPNELGYVSYFWKENEICFQVMLHEDVTNQNGIVASLMNESFADLSSLK